MAEAISIAWTMEGTILNALSQGYQSGFHTLHKADQLAETWGCIYDYIHM